MQLRDRIILTMAAAGVFCSPEAFAQRDYSSGFNDGGAGTASQGFVPNSYGSNPYNNGSGYAPSYSLNPALQGTGGAAGRVSRVSAGKKTQIQGWFSRYDQIRFRAQMNPREKQQADVLLSRKLSMFMPGPEKVATREILTSLVQRYQQALAALKALPSLPETGRLQQAYLQYFDIAMNLFSDYLRVQDNLLAVDSSGQPIAAQLLQRKLALESLEHSCKEIDAQARSAYAVNPYPY